MKPIRWLVAVCALTLVGAEGPDDLVKNELNKFQGTWKAASIQIGPKKTPDESLKGFRLVVEGDTWTVKTPGEKKSKIRLDPSKSPRHLDLIDDIAGKERVTKCIYEFKDDTLTVCRPYMQMNADRPTKFEAGGDFVGVTVWKREKK
jgi:uncharacterized protein (TIGR03067 family)